MLGICCAINYLNAKRIRVDNKKSVYKIPLLFEEFKISDIYYGAHRIDVITLYKEKTIKIPRVHVEMDILPEFYFIVQIGSKIKEAKMIGFIEGKKIPRCSCDSKFFYPTLDLIFDIKRFMSLTKQSMPVKPLLGKRVDCMGLFLKFIDNDLSSVYKRQMIQHLMNCDSCRSRFIDVMEFERLAGSIKYYPDLVHKHQEKGTIGTIVENYRRDVEFGSFEDGLQNAIVVDTQGENSNFIENGTENDDNPLTGVVPDENGKTVTRKDYALLEKFTEVTVEIPLYSTYEQAITEDSTYNYVDYHEYTNNNTGIDRIICGILEKGGAMAWIYTNCGTYTMYVESMTFNDKYHEEKLHSLLRDVSVDESLADERYGSNLWELEV